MFKLDNDLLISLGLGELPINEKNALLAHIYETLEMRGGARIAAQMSNQQLDDFESFIARSDEPGAQAFLEANFPDYRLLVAQQFDELKAEIASVADQILEAARSRSAS